MSKSRSRSGSFFSRHRPVLTGALLLALLLGAIFGLIRLIGGDGMKPQDLQAKTQWTDAELTQASLATLKALQTGNKDKNWQKAGDHVEAAIRALPPERRRQVRRQVMHTYINSSLTKLRLAATKFKPGELDNIVKELSEDLAKRHISTKEKSEANAMSEEEKKEAKDLLGQSVVQCMEAFTSDERRTFAPVIKETVRLLEELYH